MQFLLLYMLECFTDNFKFVHCIEKVESLNALNRFYAHFTLSSSFKHLQINIIKYSKMSLKFFFI